MDNDFKLVQFFDNREDISRNLHEISERLARMEKARKESKYPPSPWALKEENFLRSCEGMLIELLDYKTMVANNRIKPDILKGAVTVDDMFIKMVEDPEKVIRKEMARNMIGMLADLISIEKEDLPQYRQVRYYGSLGAFRTKKEASVAAPKVEENKDIISFE